MSEPIIGVSITAGPIQHHNPPLANDRHQLRIGATSYIYFTPAIAAQWITYLEEIADTITKEAE